MGSVKVGWAVAVPSDAPIDFAALKAIGSQYEDEADLDLLTDDNGDVLFGEFPGDGMALIWALEDAEAMIGRGELRVDERDGWQIFGAQAEDWGDGGSEEVVALQALASVLSHPSCPDPGKGGYRAAWWAEGSIPPFDSDDWFG